MFFSFAKTRPFFDKPTGKLEFAKIQLHANVVAYYKTNPIEGRAFAIWNLAHEFVHLFSALKFGPEQSPEIEKFAAYLP